MFLFYKSSIKVFFFSVLRTYPDFKIVGDENNDSGNLGLIIGGAIGGVLLIILIIIIVVCLKNRKSEFYLLFFLILNYMLSFLVKSLYICMKFLFFDHCV